ncbi:hypothetical protein HUF18_18030 [Thalassolituus sp. ST750PaO-4]|uniref:LA2681 family HEPN domain-containing protein n=1 Tax=Thalassolituus sp. ST750PaO-4 TaxID=2742965 RepID=UPI001CE39C65|nr:LA2681 family HEPN domain-containing protein [Thalassolituus sp. ST750PaO-4]MCA6061685.1 hypothetical protein [Thalassolituus sp. ST750PaO-4]
MNINKHVNDNEIQTLSTKIDQCIRNGTPENLATIVTPYVDNNLIFGSISSKASFYYILGNAFDYIYNNNTNDYFSENSGKALVCFRKALHELSKLERTEDVLQLESCIKTNAANNISSLGRLLEGTEALQEQYSKGQPVAILGITKNLINTSTFLPDQKHILKYYKEAYYSALKCDNIINYDDSYSGTISEGSIIHNFKTWYEKELLPLEIDLEDYKENYHSDIEADFKRWCGSNKLFLNPLNSLNNSPEFFYDFIPFPSVRIGIDDSVKMNISDELIYHYAFDEIITSFIYARNLLFSAIYQLEDPLKFTFQDLEQTDCLDGSILDKSSEDLKSSYRIAFSILDKIAYLLHRYYDIFDLSKDQDADFKKIFIKEKKESQYTNNKIDSENIFLAALFNILRDLRDVQRLKEESPSKWLDPESETIVEIRNHIEHRSIKVIDDIFTSCFPAPSNSNESPDKQERHIIKRKNHSLEINRSTLEKKSVQLLKLVRNSIIYLNLAIGLTEKKNQEKKPNSISIKNSVPKKKR